ARLPFLPIFEDRHGRRTKCPRHRRLRRRGKETRMKRYLLARLCLVYVLVAATCSYAYPILLRLPAQIDPVRRLKAASASFWGHDPASVRARAGLYQAQMRLASDFCAHYHAMTPQERKQGVSDSARTLEVLAGSAAGVMVRDCLQRADWP